MKTLKLYPISLIFLFVFNFILIQESFCQSIEWSKTITDYIGYNDQNTKSSIQISNVHNPNKINLSGGIIWQKEYQCKLNNINATSAYIGGYSHIAQALIDIDDDGDLDLFIGQPDGIINFYRNDGTFINPIWNLLDEKTYNIDVGDDAAPTFVDIDSDGDYDLFIGERDGNINFYRNDGTNKISNFNLIDEYYNSIDVGDLSTPTFIDIDADDDFDLFIGEKEANINYYKNDGTPLDPIWNYIDDSFSFVTARYNAPSFGDFDSDGDFDLFVGSFGYGFSFYLNDGSVENPLWSKVEGNYDQNLSWKKFLSFIDFDKDGHLDYLAGGNTKRLYLYINDGTLQNPIWSISNEDYLPVIDVGGNSAPSFADIDNDGDFDLLIGELNNQNIFYKNYSTSEEPNWNLYSEHNITFYNNYNAPSFADIDNDGDFDLFIGVLDGVIRFHKNNGTPKNPIWVLENNKYNNIDLGKWGRPSPQFADIDNDGDLDLFIGQGNGTISYYKNIGDSQNASWSLNTNKYGMIDVGSLAKPFFADIDYDGDLDLFIGNEDGRIFYYRNIGSPDRASYYLISDYYNLIDVGEDSAPFFIDIDNDSDLDLFVGESRGGLNFWRNVGGAEGEDLPDLFFSSFTFPNEFEIDKPTNVSYTLNNSGLISSNAFKINFYLKYIYSSSEIYIGSKDVDGISSSQRFDDDAFLTIPSHVDAGYYFLIARIDPDDQVSEFNEGNNTYESTDLFPVSYPNKNSTKKKRLYLVGENKNISENSDDSYNGHQDINMDNRSITWDGYYLSGNISGKNYKLNIWALSPYVVGGEGQTTTDFKAEILINDKVVAIFNFSSSKSKISSGNSYTISGAGPNTQSGDEVKLRISYAGGYGGSVFWGVSSSYIEIPDQTDVTYINDDLSNLLPEYYLFQNYPNPFNHNTTIVFYLKKSNHVTIKIYNISGQEIETLIDGYIKPGKHYVKWNSERFPSGIYFYKLKSVLFSETKKIILNK